MNKWNISDDKLQKAVDILQQTLGPEKTAQIEKLFEAKEPKSLNLSEKELKTIKTIAENPEMLKIILSSKKNLDGISQYLKKYKEEQK